MKITEMISITELSRLIGKSRPTVYKYISDYEAGDLDLVPTTMVTLFQRIEKENISKAEVYKYCEKYFQRSSDTPVAYEDVLKLLRENMDKIDFVELKKHIKEEINGK